MEELFQISLVLWMIKNMVSLALMIFLFVGFVIGLVAMSDQEYKLMISIDKEEEESCRK